MRAYFLFTGAVCLIYYVILAVCSRRLRSTFSIFWLVCGGAHLAMGCASFLSFLYRAAGLTVLLFWILFAAVEYRIIRAMYETCEEEVEWMIVLGAQVRGKRITDSLKRRLDTAADFLKKRENVKVVVSGGMGPGEEITEAEAMAGYLVRAGIEKDHIFLEDRSCSTRENLRFCRMYIKDPSRGTVIVSNNFHVYRARLIAKQEGYGNVQILSSDSNPVFLPNYLVREFFGVIDCVIFRRIRRERKK